MNYLLLFIDICLVLCVSLQFVSCFKVISNGYRWLFVWLFFTGLLVLSGYVLSFFGLLNNPYGWLGIHLVLGAMIFVTNSNKFIFPEIKLYFLWSELRKLHLSIKLLLLFIFIAGITTFLYTFICAAPLGGFSGDALGYHLPRAGFYLQQGSLEAYPTIDHRQTSFPMGAELQLVWGLVFTRDYHIYLIIQWIGIGMAGLAIYLISRRIGQDTSQSLVNSILWFATPLVWYYSGTIKNDLLITSYAITATAFLFLVNSSFYASSVGVGFGLGLAFAVKPNSLFVGIGLFLSGLYLMHFFKVPWIKLFRYILLVAIIVFLLGSFSYLSSLYYFGWPVHPEYNEASTSFQITHAILNLLRLSAELTDSMALIPDVVHRMTGIEIKDIREYFYHTIAMIPFLNVYDDRAVWGWHEHGPAFQLGRSPYPEFSLGTIILIICGLIRGIQHIKKPYVKVLYMTIIISVILQSAIIQWQPIPNLRFYLSILALAFPMMGWCLDWKMSNKHLLKWSLAALLILPLLVPIYLNYVFIRDWGDKSAETILERWGNQYEQAATQMVNTLPHNVTIGVVGGLIREYPLMGVDFSRRVIPLPKIENTCQLKQIFETYKDMDIIILNGHILKNSCKIPLQSIYDDIILAVWKKDYEKSKIGRE